MGTSSLSRSSWNCWSRDCGASLINEVLAGRPLLVIGDLQSASGLFPEWWPSSHGVSIRGFDIVTLPLDVRDPSGFGRISEASPSGDLSVGSEDGRPEVVDCSWGGLDHVGMPVIVGWGVTDLR